jgi:hypothetical protein
LNIGDHECGGETLARRISNDQRQAIVGERHEVVAIAAQSSNLSALSAVVHGGTDPSKTPHETLLDIARQHPVLANVDRQFVAGHFLLASTH